MKLQTQIEPSRSNTPIDYYSKLLLIGSCFSDTVADQLKAHLFEVNSNPFGISYNPISLAKTLIDCIEKRSFSADEFIDHNGIWYHYDLHSSWSSNDVAKLVESVNNQVDQLHQKLQSTTHLFITLGTAYGYELKSNGSVVANCHKQKADLFEKKLLSVDEIYQSLTTLYQSLKAFNPDLKITFTLSPVRHQRDGLVQNNRSKAHLRTALFEFLDQHVDCEYFPSYEILMDELRDYRFYDRDLLHPNSLAVEIIWERFKESYMDQSAFEDMKLAYAINQASSHRAFHPQSKEHQAFLNKIDQQKENFYTKYPHLNVR